MNTFYADSICLNYQGGARAIRQFELNFKGNTLAVYGNEYAGKTSLIKSIAGLECYEGNFYLNNKILQSAPNEHNIFALFDDYSLIANKTVYENLAYPLLLRKVSKNEIAILVENALVEYDIKQYQNIKVKKLTNKLKAYVGMAKIKLRNAELYLFDDILRVFSEVEKESCLNKLNKTFNKINGLIIYATSNFNEAVFFAEKVVILNAGIIEQYGTVEEISKNPNSVYVAEVVSGGQTVFEYSLLKKDANNLTLNYNNQQVVLGEDYLDRLICNNYINKEVLIAEYFYKENKQFLIMDTETEKSILK